MFNLNVLIQTALRTVALGTVFNRTFVMSGDFSGSSPMSLLLFVVDLEGHA